MPDLALNQCQSEEQGAGARHKDTDGDRVRERRALVQLSSGPEGDQ